jgi:hypothetical protein
MLDDGLLQITDNLANALRRLSQRSKKRRLWVDAIYINQAGIEERSRQVLLMRDIAKLRLF